MNWEIKKEAKIKTGKYGNKYCETRFVVYYDAGFAAFTNIASAEAFVNSL